jgi:uncharacterized protein (UPF0332 family)
MKRKDLAKYRYESAVEKLQAAKLLKENDFFKDSIYRSYYAIFSGARSLLALKEFDCAKHSGIIALFNQHFVKTGLIDKICSKIISGAQIHRQRSDYGDYVIATKQEAEEQIKNAELFLEHIKKYLDNEFSDE